ncbi:MOSC domain-containing protein [Ideonella sp. BN130291]|uniref:MOSC domain-containing protein n=1 Tax=Ideonella sp. BN130291 TaxID=3112940 RepID=UPI002E25B392|nr:MOSC N-terminal beta barrel domain-containing protein [Ideonella sp. BN130291]
MAEAGFPSATGGIGLRVTGLFVHPIKACAGVPVHALSFSDGGGVVGDREWAVTDAEGAVTWQGAYPRLALVRPMLVDGGLRLQAPGMPSLIVPRRQSRWDCEVRLWNDTRGLHESFAAEEAGADVQAWLAGVVGAPLRLVRLGAAALQRPSINPVHLVSWPSLRALDAHLHAGAAVGDLMERLRPNIVVDALEDEALQPFDEDHLARIAWPQAGVTLEATGPCVRCVVPNVDPRTASVGDEPLRGMAALSATRHPGQPVRFGVYARSRSAGSLAVGDAGWAELRF